MKRVPPRTFGALLTRALTVALVPALFAIGCSESNPAEPAGKKVSDYDADVATAWFSLQLDLVQNSPGFSPPVASRAFGYSGVALYQSLLGGMPDSKTLEGQLNGLSADAIPDADANADYHWPSVANAALARITTHLYADANSSKPDQVAKINALQTQFVTEFSGEAEDAVLNRSIAYGQAVADAVFEWSKGDGGHQGYLTNFPSTYVPPTGKGLWVPTPRRGGAPQSALQPYWGNNRPFVLNPSNPNDLSEPGAPPAYSEEVSSDFYKEANEVYTTLQSVTAEEDEIARYWADDPGATSTPPGHSISILNQCLALENKKLDFAASAYAQAGMAVADAFIGCWESKYKYNLVRPITYITDVIDPDYDYNDLPVNTPPFPEYTSGHSVQSGAAAAVLNGLFGTSFSFTDHTHDGLGYSARSFSSFDEAADEAAISRLYGGIHYRAAIERGVLQGKKIGDQVRTKIQWKN